MARVTVIGYGNPLRGDDGVGYFVAERLARRFAAAGPERDLEVLALHQLTPEVAEALINSELVVFVDADCRQPPGRLSCEVVSRRLPRPAPTTHHLDPAGLLAFARALDPASPRQALLLTVGGESFGHGEGFSPPVAAALASVEQLLDQCLESFFSSGPSSLACRVSPAIRQ
jgi:hydrogenase maturation protease